MRKVLMLAAFNCLVFSAISQFSKATLQATGLTCAMCNNAINKALQKVSFVETVRSDIKNSSFSIVFKTGEAISIDALKAAVEDAGFSVGNLKLTGHFEEVKIGPDQHVSVGGQIFHFLNVQEQVLNGEASISVVDKNFIPEKQFKKIAASSKMACVQTGKSAECCTKSGVAAGSRVYHVTM